MQGTPHRKKDGRQLTLNGKLFLASVLFLRYESEIMGKRLRIWQVMKAWSNGEIARLNFRINVK